MTDASGQRCGNCRYASGKVRIGTCTWDEPIPIWAQAEMGGVFREMHAIHGKDCPTWHAK